MSVLFSASFWRGMDWRGIHEDLHYFILKASVAKCWNVVKFSDKYVGVSFNVIFWVFHKLQIFLHKYTHTTNLATSDPLCSHSSDPRPHFISPTDLESHLPCCSLLRMPLFTLVICTCCARCLDSSSQAFCFAPSFHSPRSLPEWLPLRGFP